MMYNSYYTYFYIRIKVNIITFTKVNEIYYQTVIDHFDFYEY